MAEFKEVAIQDFTCNPFTSIGKDWMLISAAKKDGSANTMTAAWGGLGWLWERPVAYLFVRQSRFTKEFIDETGKVSLSFLGKGFRKEFGYLGTISGRQEDKIAHSGLTLSFDEEIPFFEESETVIFGHIISEQIVTEDTFLDETIAQNHYTDHNLHSVYVLQIDKILRQEM